MDNVEAAEVGALTASLGGLNDINKNFYMTPCIITLYMIVVPYIHVLQGHRKQVR